MFLDNLNSKYNRYKINQMPQLETGAVTVLLNLSNDLNFDVLMMHAVDRAKKKDLPVRGLFLDLSESMTDQMVEEINEKFSSSIKENHFSGDARLDIENQSFHNLLDNYFQNAAIVICDSGFTNAEKRWRHYLAKTIHCEMVRVERRRSNKVFSLEKVVDAVSSEKISLSDLMSWINNEEDLYFA